MLRRGAVLGLVTALVAAWAVSTAPARTAHYGLTVTVSGQGRVTGPDIDCPSDCFASIPSGDVVSLTAIADDGAEFTGWGDDCVESGTSTECQLLMNRARTASAGFGAPVPPPVPRSVLTVAKEGTGTGYVGGGGGIDCGPTCAAELPNGTSVTLVAVPDPGSEFDGWGGGCSGKNECTVVLAGNTTLAAVFTHRDTKAPSVSTLRASARRGARVLLRYRVWDDSRESSEQLTVLRGKVLLARIAIRTHPALYRTIYSAPWRVPARLAPGPLAFCAVAVDEAGNRSKRSCSTLRVTR